MASMKQVLELDPDSELTFKGPFTEAMTSHLRLTNPSARAVYFKVKTTAPRYYCVRPNVGMISPKDYVVINIGLQPVGQPSLLEAEQRRHKFMVLAAFATIEEVPVDSFWQNVEQSDVMNSKLRVAFVQSAVHENGGGESIAPKKPLVETSKYPVSRMDGQLTLQEAAESNDLYQDQDQNRKLEHENASLHKKLDKFGRHGKFGHFDNVENFHLLRALFIGFIALFLGIIIGKIL